MDAININCIIDICSGVTACSDDRAIHDLSGPTYKYKNTYHLSCSLSCILHPSSGSPGIIQPPFTNTKVAALILTAMARVLAWRAPQYATLLLITLLSCTHSQAFFFNKPSKPAADGGSGGAQGGAVASATGNAASGAASAGIGQQTLHNQPTHYYYNTLTGETQWDPPGACGSRPVHALSARSCDCICVSPATTCWHRCVQARPVMLLFVTKQNPTCPQWLLTCRTRKGG